MTRQRARRWRQALAALALLAALAPVQALAQDGLTVAEARASMVGRWEGTLELLEEGAASEAFEWPIAVSIENAGDGRTHIERQQAEGMTDDGALTTTVTLLDPDGVTEHGTTFVGGSVPEHRTLTLSLAAGRDAAHWTLHGVEDYVRDGEALQARYVVIRDGDTLISTFEVDPAGDEPPFGTTRKTLRRVATAP